MYTEGYDQWIKLNKNFSTPVTELNKATTDMCKHVAEQNLELMGENFSRFSEQLKKITHVKKPEDLINLQKECMQENMTATMECMQKIMRTSMENMEELTKLFGSFHSNTETRKPERSSK